MSTYANYDDLARFEYGRILWRNPEDRQRLIRHWTDSRHPYRERFLQHRELVEFILDPGEDVGSLETSLAARGSSLRAAVREIPPVFGSFWHH